MSTTRTDARREPLRRLAFLNSLTGGVDFAAKQVVGFVVNPITVSFLGPTLYGVWKIIQQLNNYLATADINVAQPLKLLVATERGVASDVELRRSFTAALTITAAFIPVYAVAGTVVVWIAPRVASVDPELYPLVRTAAAFLVGAFILRQVGSLFEGVLRGMNLMYKRMGLRAGITVLGGAGTVSSLYMGYGLVGIAVVHVLVALLVWVTLWWMVARYVGWFGFAKPTWGDLRKMSSLGGWFAASKLLTLGYKSSDILLAGILLGPELAGAFAISKFLMNSVTGVTSQMGAATTPGLGKLYGSGRIDKVLTARSQIITLLWCVATVPGIVICLWNGPFIAIWTEPFYFIGQLETLLIVLVGMQAAIQLVDNALVDISLEVRMKMLFTFGSVVTTVAGAFLLAPRYGAAGLLLAILLGKLVMTVSYALNVRANTGARGLVKDLMFTRTAIACTVLLLLAGALGSRSVLTVEGWPALLFGIAVTGALAFPTVLLAATSARDRSWMWELVGQIRGRPHR